MEHKRGADRRKHHIIYKTTCIPTGKFYIGMHSTDNLNDGYMGSGKYLGYSLRKYGKEKHICEVMEHLPTREALRAREEELVNAQLLEHVQCMNLQVGGRGDWGWTSPEEKQAARLQKLSEAWKRPGYRENFKAKTTGRKRSEESKGLMKAAWSFERRTATSDRAITDRTLAKSRIAAKGARIAARIKTKGELDLEARLARGPIDYSAQSKQGWETLRANPEKLEATKAAMKLAKAGKVWVCNDTVSAKLIRAEELETYLSSGWSRGTKHGEKLKGRVISAETRAKLAEAARKQHSASRSHVDD